MNSFLSKFLYTLYKQPPYHPKLILKTLSQQYLPIMDTYLCIYLMYMYKPNLIFHYEFVNSDYPKAGGRKIFFFTNSSFPKKGYLHFKTLNEYKTDWYQSKEIKGLVTKEEQMLASSQYAIIKIKTSKFHLLHAFWYVTQKF